MYFSHSLQCVCLINLISYKNDEMHKVPGSPEPVQKMLYKIVESDLDGVYVRILYAVHATRAG